MYLYIPSAQFLRKHYFSLGFDYFMMIVWSGIFRRPDVHTALGWSMGIWIASSAAVFYLCPRSPPRPPYMYICVYTIWFALKHTFSKNEQLNFVIGRMRSRNPNMSYCPNTTTLLFHNLGLRKIVFSTWGCSLTMAGEFRQFALDSFCVLEFDFYSCLYLYLCST